MYSLLRLIVYVSVGTALGALGTMAVRGPSGGTAKPGEAQTDAAPKKYTCSMHPQIVMDHPDKCPLCGMDLEPIQSGGSGGADDSPETLTLSERARQMPSVATSEVRRRELFKEIRTVGKVELDETRVAYIAARVAGRVDQVFADFPGTPVRKGEHLVSIYSPDLVSTQDEYLLNQRYEQAQRGSGRTDLGGPLSEKSRRRLLLWGITEAQIEELARSGKARTHLIVYAPIGGIVIEKKIRPGQYVKEGDMLYTIADLSQVWLVIDVYESELSWTRIGQAVQVTLESEPTRPVTGRVAFVEPVLNEATRTVRVRVILENPDLRFKPAMYAQVLVKVAIMPDGTPGPTHLAGKYVCILPIPAKQSATPR